MMTSNARCPFGSFPTTPIPTLSRCSPTGPLPFASRGDRPPLIRPRRFFSRAPEAFCGRKPRGLALIDGPNLLCTLHDLMSRVDLPEASNSLDLLRLHDYLESLGFDEFVFVQPFSATRSRINLERDVRSSGWTYQQPTQCIYGYDDTDCADDYIRYRISEAAGQYSDVALISHDGGYRRSLETYLQAGGNAMILGFTKQMSHKLVKLCHDDRPVNQGTAQILDLQLDVQAVEFSAKNRHTVGSH